MLKSILLALTLCFSAYADDGEVGTTSTGSSNIQVVILPRLIPKEGPQVTYDTNLDLQEDFTKEIIERKGSKTVIYFPK